MAKQNGKKITAKFNGTCGHCAEAIQTGDTCVFYASQARNRTWHIACAVRESLRIKRGDYIYLALRDGGRDESHYRALADQCESQLYAPVRG